MGRGRLAGRRRVRARASVVAVAVLALVASACALLPLGSAGAKLGNDVGNCPSFQPSQAAPCGPQPMVWASIAGPYAPFDLGDPYATKCGRELPASEADCTTGPYPGGATNALYDPGGYEYVVDVRPGDVGKAMNLQVWDAGSYPRHVGGTFPKTTIVQMLAGDTTLNRRSGEPFTPADVGRGITGPGLLFATTVATYVSPDRITISQSPNMTGIAVPVTVPADPDCPSAVAPFNAAPYTSVTWDERNCQTGDTGTAPFQIEVVRTDGSGAILPSCSRYIAAGTNAATYKNRWATVCSFTPAAAERYVVRVKSSAIVVDGAPVPDQGDGANSFALRLQGGSTSRLYAIGALSILANTPASTSRFYLTELPSTAAGKRLLLDIFDPGDGEGGEYVVQVLGPPAGAPGAVPTAGTVVPGTGIADSCRYNPVASPTPGPDVDGPAGTDAVNCRILLRTGAVNLYDDAWLRIQIDLAPTYACTTDCWWSVRLDNGGVFEAPEDHQVWVPQLVPVPAGP